MLKQTPVTTSQDRLKGREDVLISLRAAIDGMKSTDGSITSNVMNSIFEEVYQKTKERVEC